MHAIDILDDDDKKMNIVKYPWLPKKKFFHISYNK